jgi:YesN/AraC family two-component response regulator
MMPEMSGLEMLEQVRKDFQISHIPVIILTAMDAMESNIKGLEVGADAHITKPFSETLLIHTINNLLRSRDKIKEVFGLSRLIDISAGSKNKQDQVFIKKCIEVIYENIEDESFHIESLAEIMNISRSAFYKKIKEITKLKAVDFVKNAKLHYAAKLLLSSTLNINEIAWKSGFTDVKYFSKCFSAQYECNPSIFRSKIKSN